MIVAHTRIALCPDLSRLSALRRWVAWVTWRHSLHFLLLSTSMWPLSRLLLQHMLVTLHSPSCCTCCALHAGHLLLTWLGDISLRRALLLRTFRCMLSWRLLLLLLLHNWTSLWWPTCCTWGPCSSWRGDVLPRVVLWHAHNALLRHDVVGVALRQVRAEHQLHAAPR